MDMQQLVALLEKLQGGLVECQGREQQAVEARLRQEGAIMALNQIIRQAQMSEAQAQAATAAEWSDSVVAGLVEQVLPGVLQAAEGGERDG